MKFRRSNTDDCERMFVEADGAANDATIVLKMRVPIAVGKDDVRSAVRAVLIGAVDEASEMGLHAQHVEVIAADFIEPCGGGIIARVEPGGGDGIRGETVEAAVAVAEVEIVGI